MASYSFEIATSVAIPVVAYVVNWRWRKDKGLDYTSSAADLVLAVWTFDLVILTAEKVFESALQNDVLLKNFNSVTVLLLLFSLLVWSWPSLAIEKKMTRPTAAATAHRVALPDMTWPIASWACAAAVLSAHIYVFFKGP